MLCQGEWESKRPARRVATLNVCHVPKWKMSRRAVQFGITTRLQARTPFCLHGYMFSQRSTAHCTATALLGTDSRPAQFSLAIAPNLCVLAADGPAR